MKCPQCSNEMNHNEMKRNETDFTLEGLPNNKNKLMEVVEYYDIGYEFHPVKLNYWTCPYCLDKIMSLNDKYRDKACNFIIFKDGTIYSWENPKWVKYKPPKVPFQFR
jgi:hypothetical protein